MNKSSLLWTVGGALVFGLLTGWLDFNAEEVQLSALMVIAFSFGFSAANPQKAWLIALLMGGGIPVFSFTARALDFTPRMETTPWYAGTVLPLVIAFVAAYVGVLFNWLVKKSRSGNGL